jgi:alkylation response protein AidB-like acyl-CoA dehydrogenase
LAKLGIWRKEFNMDLLYTKEENEFRMNLSHFLNKELAPMAEKIEKSDEIPFDFFRKLGANEYMGVLHPKEFGGSEKGLLYNHIVSDEICYYSAATDITRAASTVYFGVPVNHWGTLGQKKKYLPPIIKGLEFGALAITEPTGGSDAAGMHMNVVEKGGVYVLNGEKIWITNSSFASFICVFAITNPKVNPHLGISAFIVEKGTPGFKVIKNLKSMGVFGSSHSYIQFENCKVPRANLLGKENEGWNVLMDELQSERIDIASRGLGCARRAFEEAVKYSATREQFGRKISHFEGISFKIADMKVALDAARLLIVRAARLYDQGLSIEKEAAIAKLFSSEASFRIADQALQIHGAFGYSKDSIVERLFRDTRVYGFGGGTSEIMRFLIQREVYKEFGYGKWIF